MTVVYVKAAEVAGIAKNAEVTAVIADFAKISGGELGQIKQLGQTEPLIIFGHRFIGRPHAVIAVREQRFKIAIEDGIPRATRLTTQAPPATRRPIPCSAPMRAATE